MDDIGWIITYFGSYAGGVVSGCGIYLLLHNLKQKLRDRNTRR